MMIVKKVTRPFMILWEKILSEGNFLNGKKIGPWKTYIGDSIYFSNY